MRQATALILLPVLACGAAVVPLAADPQAGREVPLPSTTFIDSKTFDRKMSRMMKAKLETIAIDFAQKPSPNDLPKRLDAWLNAVDKHGGTIEIKPTEATRGVVSALVYLASGAIRAAKKNALYGGARHYNAVVYYSPGSGLVERVLFSRKED